LPKVIEERGLHIDEHGSGPAVVLLHGTPSAVADFEPIVARLAGRHRVLVPHFPGYGRTPPDREPSSLAATVSRLERRLMDVGVSGAALVAFSGGAYKAVALALRDRVRVSHLFLCAPVVGLDPDAAAGYRGLVDAVRRGTFDPRPSWLERMTTPGFAVRDPDGARRVLAWLDAAPMAVICDELVAMADAHDLRPRLHEVACPVLVCAGTADRAVPLSSSEDVARRALHGTFERIDGAGHALLIEAPDRVVGLLDDFLSRPASKLDCKLDCKMD
jgi:3-oxoadipate enol-lactonase